MELILRFLAFFYYADKYQSPMKDFLNRYMATNRNLQKQPEDILRNLFSTTAKVVLDGLGVKAFRPKRAINAAVVDSLMTGIAKRIVFKGSPIRNFKELNRRFEKLMSDETYIEAVETGTSQEANVQDRLKRAEEAFVNLS